MNAAEIRAKLNEKAKEISSEFNGAPVLVVVAGSKEHDIPNCTIGRANLVQGREPRLRDLLGILETAKQIEAIEHLRG